MGLNCLLVTGDATLLEVFRKGFCATSVELEMRTDAASAIELSARRHLDGFIIDCDGVERAMDLLVQITRQSLQQDIGHRRRRERHNQREHGG